MKNDHFVQKKIFENIKVVRVILVANERSHLELITHQFLENLDIPIKS